VSNRINLRGKDSELELYIEEPNAWEADQWAHKALREAMLWAKEDSLRILLPKIALKVLEYPKEPPLSGSKDYFKRHPDKLAYLEKARERKESDNLEEYALDEPARKVALLGMNIFMQLELGVQVCLFDELSTICKLRLEDKPIRLSELSEVIEEINSFNLIRHEMFVSVFGFFTHCTEDILSHYVQVQEELIEALLD